jgi:4-hydroxybenzoyl-CoA reductase subunit beta
MSMLLPPFRLHEPTTVQEAANLRAEFPQSDFVSGGTDLLPNYKWLLNTKPHVISLHRIDGLRTIDAHRIGAGVTLAQLANDPTLQRELPVLGHTAGLIASPLIRNSGTVGGNLLLDNRCFFYNQAHMWRESINFCLKASGDACHVVPQKDLCYATFSADLPGPLIALGAEYELVSAKGTRRVQARDFYKNDGIDRHNKRPDELLAAVHLPSTARQLRASYEKLRQRESWDFPELGMACALRIESGTLKEFHLVANALEMAPKVLDDLGQRYLGERFTDQAILDISKSVEEQVRPVKNTNLSPSYRKRMSRVFAERAMRAARDGIVATRRTVGPTL